MTRTQQTWAVPDTGDIVTMVWSHQCTDDWQQHQSLTSGTETRWTEYKQDYPLLVCNYFAKPYIDQKYRNMLLVRKLFLSFQGTFICIRPKRQTMFNNTSASNQPSLRHAFKTKKVHFWLTLLPLSFLTFYLVNQLIFDYVKLGQI